MRWLVALVLVVGCHSSSESKPSKSAGPLWSPAMYRPLHSLTPDCDMKANLWECHGNDSTAKVTLDDSKHLLSIEVTYLTRLSDEPPILFRNALTGIVPPAAIDAVIKHLATAWPTETEDVAGVHITVTRTQKEAGKPVLFDATVSW